MQKKFHNGDLNKDFPRHLRADELTISKGEYNNGEEQTWCIDVNDDSYFYYNEKHRNQDFHLLQATTKAIQ